MKNNPGFWIVLCILIVQVSSSKENETKIIDDDPKYELSNQINLTIPMEMKKRFFQDGKFTESQKIYVYAMIPVVTQMIGPRAPIKNIISLIVDFFKPVVPVQHFYHRWNYENPIILLLSPDNRWIASDAGSNPPCSLFLWNVITGEKEQTLSGHTDRISECVFTSDSQFLISASWDTSLKLWSVLTGDLLHTFTGHTDGVASCALSKDDRFLLSTAFDATVRLWDIEIKTCTHILRGHTKDVEWGRFFANDQQIVSVCEKNIRVWDIDSGECMYHLENNVSYLLTCTLSSDEKLLLVGFNVLNVWKRAALVQTFKQHNPSGVCSALFVSNDTCIASLDTNGTILIWRWVDGDIIHRFENCNIFVNLQYSYWQKKQNKEYIIVATEKYPYEIQVVAVETGDIRYTSNGHEQGIDRVQVSTDGNFLISYDADGFKSFLLYEE